MYLQVGEQQYELKTKLGTSWALEQRFKRPLSDIFEMLGTSEIPELIDILATAAGEVEKGVVEGETVKVSTEPFKLTVIDAFDYTDLVLAVRELIARLMFSGTPEESEEKINKYTKDEEVKNGLRELIGLPLTSDSGNE